MGRYDSAIGWCEKCREKNHAACAGGTCGCSCELYKKKEASK